MNGAAWLPPAPEVHTSPQSAGGDWRSRLIADKRTHEPRPLLANAITALRTAPEWSGVLGWDEFSSFVVATGVPVFGGEVGSNWIDHQDRQTADWLQHEGIAVGVEVAGQAVQVVARDNVFHPVRRYLEGLTWDRVPRAAGWLNLYLGVEPSDYSVAVGERGLRSAVA